MSSDSGPSQSRLTVSNSCADRKSCVDRGSCASRKSALKKTSRITNHSAPHMCMPGGVSPGTLMPDEAGAFHELIPLSHEIPDNPVVVATRNASTVVRPSRGHHVSAEEADPDEDGNVLVDFMSLYPSDDEVDPMSNWVRLVLGALDQSYSNLV